MRTDGLSRKDKDKIRHRDYILSAALELFSEKGYYNVSMHEIAAKAEFAIGTLYKFFKNKEDLYKYLIMSKAQEYHDTLYDVLSAEKDAISIISDYVSAKFSIFADNAPAFRLYFVGTKDAYFNIQAGFDQEIQTLYNDLLNRISIVLENGICSGALKKMRSYYMAMALEGITNTFLYNMLENSEQDFTEVDTSMITGMFLHGILKE
jgi:AcrR family transcriptional regulator